VLTIFHGVLQILQRTAYSSSVLHHTCLMKNMTCYGMFCAAYKLGYSGSRLNVVH